MNDLRIALLAVGAAVVVVLVGWEWFQRRAARRAEKDLIAWPLGRKPDGTEVHDDPLFESPRGNDRARVEPSISFDGVGADEHDSDAREPPTSTVPTDTLTVPSTPMLTVEQVCPPKLNQKPQAMPRPWLGPSLIFICGWFFTASSVGPIPIGP